MTLILASKSAARRAILAGAGLTHEAVVSGVDEDALKAQLALSNATPPTIALELSKAKALAVSRLHPKAWVIGADQVLELDGAPRDKAPDLARARAQLGELNGKTHYLRSGVALAQGGKIVWAEVASAEVKFRQNSAAFLDAYVAAEPEICLSSVGAYALEGRGVQLLEQVDGDYFTVLGLPLFLLLPQLRARGEIAE